MEKHHFEDYAQLANELQRPAAPTQKLTVWDWLQFALIMALCWCVWQCAEMAQTYFNLRAIGAVP